MRENEEESKGDRTVEKLNENESQMKIRVS